MGYGDLTCFSIKRRKSGFRNPTKKKHGHCEDPRTALAGVPGGRGNLVPDRSAAARVIGTDQKRAARLPGAGCRRPPPSPLTVSVGRAMVQVHVSAPTPSSASQYFRPISIFVAPAPGTYTLNSDCTGTITIPMKPGTLTVHLNIFIAPDGGEFFLLSRQIKARCLPGRNRG
jgi:hypothetical protein